MRFGDAEMKKVCATFSMTGLSYQRLKNMFILLFDDLKNQQHNAKISFAFKVHKIRVT
jgi:predicted DNA binding CopG/RHH family protein